MKTKRRNMLIRALLLLPGVLLLLWFIAPLPGGIVNIANILGIALCSAWVLACLLWSKLTAGLKRLRAKRSWRVLTNLLGVLLAAGLGLLLTLVALVLSGMHSTTDNRSTLIVLGCQVQGQRPSLLLHNRIEAAYDYLAAHPDAVCIASGGQGSGEDISEAACIASGLKSRGIAAERLYLEEESTNTEENIRNSLALIRHEGLSKQTVLVSNNFHLYRALLLAERAGLDAEGLAAKGHFFSQATYILREALGVFRIWILGR